MPNWCEGFLKVRGTIPQLKKFIIEGFQLVDIFGNELENLSIDCNDDTSLEVSGINETLWLKGTHRNFCKFDDIGIYSDSPETSEVLILYLQAAWCIETEPLLNVCKKFEVDMKIQGFESGMQFSQIIEIVDGKILQDEIIHYDNWDWDCPCPLMGG